MIDRRRVIDELRAEGLDITEWTDDAGTHYTEHAHPRDEVIVVLDGQITFVLGGAESRLGAGDRLELPAGAAHIATVGPSGATYLVARR